MMPLQAQPDTPQLTSTAQDRVNEMNDPMDDTKQDDVKTKKRHDDFRSRIDICKMHRRKLISNWVVSIDYRRGKPFASQSDEDQIAVNLDWSITNDKQAELFSQVPQARVNHGEDLLPQQTPWVIPFQKKLNDTLVSAGIESAMDECLPDCINAAGIGVVMVSYEAITQDTELPVDPTNPSAGTTTIPKIVDHRYLTQRVSPADFLWPLEFTGSNFDHAPWVGRSGRLTWAAAKQQYGLDDAEKETILGEDKPIMDKLTHDIEKDKLTSDNKVGFDEIFYREYDYIEGASSFNAIRRMVFLNGKTDPVVDEPWKGQKIDEQSGLILGAQRYPVRVLTLNYITDENIPPSYSAIGRPQINEINKGRGQMIRQRERSLPVRAFDVNRLDPTISQRIMQGTWQSWIPVQGDATKVVTEVARANMPNENFKFYEIAKADLMQLHGFTPQQESEGGTNSDGSPRAHVNTRVIRERAIVSSFFAGIAEVLGGILCLYEDPNTLGQGFDPKFSTTLNYSILADSTVVLDSNQRLARLNQFVNTYAKSGWVNLAPVLQEIAMLSGLDPTAVITPPQPKPPETPNISLRLTGVEDLLNPLALAMLINSGQAPKPEMIDQAKLLIEKSVVPNQPPPPQPGVPGMPPAPGQAPIPPVPGPPPPAVGDAHPDATIMPHISDRSESKVGGN